MAPLSQGGSGDSTACHQPGPSAIPGGHSHGVGPAMGSHWVWAEGGHCLCSGGWRERFLLGWLMTKLLPPCRCCSIPEDQVHLCHPVSVPEGCLSVLGGVFVCSAVLEGKVSFLSFHLCLSFAWLLRGSQPGLTVGAEPGSGCCPNHSPVLPLRGPFPLESSGGHWAMPRGPSVGRGER